MHWRNYMPLRDFAQVNMFHVEHKTENFTGVDLCAFA
ncbi:hypothetical protein EV673_1641 [Limnobacter thiooxidans]|nr:hypothetical protein EV673_1641 [Limnobacter thiooxidans]